MLLLLTLSFFNFLITILTWLNKSLWTYTERSAMKKNRDQMLEGRDMWQRYKIHLIRKWKGTSVKLLLESGNDDPKPIMKTHPQLVFTGHGKSQCSVKRADNCWLQLGQWENCFLIGRLTSLFQVTLFKVSKRVVCFTHSWYLLSWLPRAQPSSHLFMY